MPDVASDTYYTAAVNWAVAKGYITGYAATGTFGPDDSLTAEMLCVILCRIQNGTGNVQLLRTAITDGGSVSDWARNGCAWALQNGVLSGYDNGDGTRSLHPGETIYRARAASVLVNASESNVLTPKGSPADGPDLSGLQVGHHVLFGSYEQDNNLANGTEPIEWRVLDVADGKALLVSEYGLDSQMYNFPHTSVTWETCTLRPWLNDTFFNAAFSATDQARIATTVVANDDNPDHGTPGGNDTQDKVFCLSIAEASRYFADNVDRVCAPTAYVAGQRKVLVESGACRWWLRSPGYNEYNPSFAGAFAAGVDVNGSVSDGHAVAFYYAVRPAMWVNL
ncbi:MAG: DUF6273 domain-containing protein [Coriobacteriia bacterium]|nr:DUF6273 domain-containing protein [Coriobacteriia bacterium]